MLFFPDRQQGWKLLRPFNLLIVLLWITCPAWPLCCLTQLNVISESEEELCAKCCLYFAAFSYQYVEFCPVLDMKNPYLIWPLPGQHYSQFRHHLLCRAETCVMPGSDQYYYSLTLENTVINQKYMLTPCLLSPASTKSPHQPPSSWKPGLSP